MGEAARRRRAAAKGSAAPASGRATPSDPDPTAAASASLTRLVRLNKPGQVSIAGAYALGYAALGMAQHDGDGPDWYDQLDPLDTLFLGALFPEEPPDEYAFGNARTAWLRRMRTTAHWRGIERFVTEVVTTSEHHQLPVDEGELMLLVAGRLEAAGLDQRKLPAALLPRAALADARCLRGPDPTLVLPAPPADAAEQVARLWAGTDVDLPHDGTPADALREGLYLLGRTGMDVRADPAILLVAMYLALVASDSDTLSEAPSQAEAWALGVADDSPLVPVLDVLLLAHDRRLDVDTVLAHLYGVAAFTQPAPDADRRFTSTPGRALTDLAFELGFRQVDTRDTKIMRMDPDTTVKFQAQLRAFEDKFGRPPGPDDPVFFDPDADEPRPMPVAGMERSTTAMLQAVGVCGAWIYACQHTDGLLPRPDGTFNTDADAREWNDAIDRYLRAHPGETVDDAAELGKLRAMLAMISLDMAARDPHLGASLARQLYEAEPLTPGGDADVVAEFLNAAADSITETLGDPTIVDKAAELARGWSGAAMAQRVHDAASGDPDDVDLDILLAFAAARLADT
jgi:hypothetical protein